MREAITLAKKLVRLETGHCEKCGREDDPNAKRTLMQGSHIIPVGAAPLLAANTKNILCLCLNCHKLGNNAWHADPLSNAEWFHKNYPGLYQELLELKETTKEADWEPLYWDLKEKVDAIEEKTKYESY